MAAETCTACGSTSLIYRDDYGANACLTCGVVQEFTGYVQHFGGLAGQPNGTNGTIVTAGTNGPGSTFSYKERKLHNAGCTMDEIAKRLGLSDHTEAEVRSMVDQITEGEFGMGDWFSDLVGACAYIVRRKINRPLQISEVANAVECDAYDLGRMVDRVVRHLGCDIMPEFDIVSLLETTMRGYSGFREVGEDKVNLMVKQGCFIVQCTIKWFLTTGRRPGPIVVAVLVFVANLNGFEDVKLGKVASEVNVALYTCKKRYSELLNALVKVARNLPWGKDVNVNNIMKNAPFVIQYMDMKSRGKKPVDKRKKVEESGVGVDLEELIGECLGGDVEDGKSVKSDLSYYGGCNKNRSSREVGMDVEKFKLSIEMLRRIYSKFNGSDGPGVNLPPKVGRMRMNSSGYDLDDIYGQWWSGRSKLCEKLMLEKILKRDVGLEALPPSFIRGKENVSRRREKIKTAKVRIADIVTANGNKKSLVCSSDVVALGEEGVGFGDEDDGRKSKRRKKTNSAVGEIDWEDFIIETLLLHQVKEEEIEEGGYNRLLDLYVFGSGEW